MELTGLAEHEDFERGAEDMELRHMRQEADEMSRREYESEMAWLSDEVSACLGHSFDEGALPVPSLGERCTFCGRRSEEALLKIAAEEQEEIQEVERLAMAEPSEDDILF